MWDTFALTRQIQEELKICDQEVARHFQITFRLTVTRYLINLERTTPLRQWKEVFSIPNETNAV